MGSALALERMVDMRLRNLLLSRVCFCAEPTCGVVPICGVVTICGVNRFVLHSSSANDYVTLDCVGEIVFTTLKIWLSAGWVSGCRSSVCMMFACVPTS